jgi:CheY-like chemotaxis protein
MNDDLPHRNATVLVVEDEALVRDMIAEELRDAGFAVLEAEDGEVASTLLTDSKPVDVLFTDIRLPGQLDGWAIARLARQLRANLPVIYATGYTVDRAAEVPGAIFLHKPYQPSQIVETIDRLLRAGSATFDHMNKVTG